MREYIIERTWDAWNDGQPLVKTLVVHETENVPVFSGLLDAHGNRLMAVDRRDPIGFVRHPKANG